MQQYKTIFSNINNFIKIKNIDDQIINIRMTAD